MTSLSRIGWLALCALMLAAAGCGQTGPLFLPEPESDTAPAAAETGAPNGEDADDDEESDER
jgi:predicted small lipoprotein YifL